MGCQICGAGHATCGGPSIVQPIDAIPLEVKRMGPVRRYRDAKGNVWSLSPEDAERRGGFTQVEPEGKAVEGPPANKARRPAAKKSTEPPPPTDPPSEPPPPTDPPSA